MVQFNGNLFINISELFRDEHRFALANFAANQIVSVLVFAINALKLSFTGVIALPCVT